MPNPTPHRTPLRRISQGSLFRLSRSSAYPDAPQGLGFIEPAMSEFVDEAEALQNNVEAMKRLSDSLTSFNESFASWLYVMRMNALTTDWSQAPTDASFELAKKRAEHNALAAKMASEAEAARAAVAAVADRTAITEADTTYSASNATTIVSTHSAKSANATKKRSGKPKLTAKEKKERSNEIERIIMTLPLEFRGSDPNLRRNMENVIEGLIDAPGKAVKLTDLIKPPDLPQARVNKCLIALVNRRIVRKDNSTGTVIYHWLGVA